MIEWIVNLFSDRTFGSARSPRWSAVRKSFLALHPKCAVCGTKGSFLKPNEVHHKIPVNFNAALELVESNFITLCKVHHLWIGHLGSFRSYNNSVEADADYWREKIANRP